MQSPAESLRRLWLLLLRQDAKFARINAKWLARRNQTTRKPMVAPGGPVVSLTTYGKRTETVHLSLESIASGSMLPSRIILWLDNPNTFKNLPPSLQRLEERGLEIKLSDNYGPHTKYYPFVESTDTFERPLVTADDDVLYPQNWLSGLVRSFNQNPTAVNCYRAHVMKFAGKKIAPYVNWSPCTSVQPNFLHFATGSYGCIYPPFFLRELRTAGSEFSKLCPAADDVWLHVNAVRAGVKIKQIAQLSPKFPFVPGTQDSGLCLSNVELNQNDIQIKKTYQSADIAFLQSQAHQKTQPAQATPSLDAVSK
jgi:hypothetical protein